MEIVRKRQRLPTALHLTTQPTRLMFKTLKRIYNRAARSCGLALARGTTTAPVAGWPDRQVVSRASRIRSVFARIGKHHIGVLDEVADHDADVGRHRPLAAGQRVSVVTAKQRVAEDPGQVGGSHPWRRRQGARRQTLVRGRTPCKKKKKKKKKGGRGGEHNTTPDRNTAF